MKFKKILCILAVMAAFVIWGAISAAAADIEDVSMYPFAEAGAFKGLSEAQISEIETRAAKALNKMEKSVDISDMNIDPQYASSVFNVIFRLREEVPGYFYVDGLLGSVLQGGKLIGVQLNYLYSKEEVIQKTTEIVNSAVEIMAMMYASGVKTDFDKALWLHDYILTNTEYDNTLSKHGLDSAMLEHTAVCQGYTNIYKYLLNIAGVECVNVYNTAREHEWSRVKLDGKWYNVDMTFDDPSYEFVHDRLGFAEHTYFLLTDAEIQKYDKHEPQYSYTASGVTCTDTRYSGITFRNAQTIVAFVGNDRYYVTADRNIVKCDSNMNIINPVYYHINELWYVRDSRRAYFNGYYGGLGVRGSCLYYNTGDKLMRLNTAAPSPSPEVIYQYTPSDSYFPSGVYLFGSYVRGNVMYFAEANFRDVTDSNGNATIDLYGTKNDRKMAFDIGD